jgi:hypothetical protein
VPVVSVIGPKKDKPDQLEIRFINPIDWKGSSVEQITTEGAAKISEKFGSLFRAFKSEPKKKAPPMPTAATPTVPKAKTIEDVYEEAWKVYVTHTPALSDDERNAQWIGLVSQSKAKGLTGEQFVQQAAVAGQQANDDDLPF